MGEDIFTGRLLKGERILWAGKPGKGIVFMPSDVIYIPFSLLWGGGIIFITIAASASNQSPVFTKLFGVVGIAFGLFFIFGRFFADAWIRSGMDYAVTDQRILILRRLPNSKFTAVNLSKLDNVVLAEKSNGRGNILLSNPGNVWARGGNSMGRWMPSIDPTPQFIDIENVRGVFDLIQRHTLAPR